VLLTELWGTGGAFTLGILSCCVVAGSRLGAIDVEYVFADAGAAGLAGYAAVTEFEDGDRLAGATGLVAKLFIT